MVDEDTKLRFRENGYVIIPGLLTEQEIAALKSAIVAPIQQLLALDGYPQTEVDWKGIHRSLAQLKKKDETRYLNALKISQNDPTILAFSAHQNIHKTLVALGLAHPIVALKPFPILMAPDLYIEGGYNLRPFHQEWPVMQGSTDGVVTWTALTDITKEHNALEIIPQSHKKGMREFERSSCGTKVSNLDLAQEQEPVRIEMNAGDSVIFSTFTLHRTSPIGNALRAALSVRFNNLAAIDFIEDGFYDPSAVVIDREPKDMKRPRAIKYSE